MAADTKYIVFKREEFYQMMGGFLPTGNVDCAPVAQRMQEAAEGTCLQDAVVIRRQDHFAPAALHVYASSIGLTAKLARVHEPVLAKQLQAISDYFHEQAVLAEAEAFKLPD